MISLEIAISNFKSLNYQEDPTTTITLRFGQISTSITLVAGEGGKCLYLDLSPEELQELYLNYACGLFILNRSGKFFSLLSFEKMRLEDRIICNQIVFYNDLREVKYQCEFSLVAKGFKNPRVADTGKLEARDNALAMFKKPPLPKQSPPKAKPQQNQGKKTISSFLYGGKAKEVAPAGNYDNLQTLKQDLRKQSEVRANLQKSKNNFGQLPKAAMTKQPQSFEDEDPFENNPPVMEFTNFQPETVEVLRVPQVEYIEYQQSHDRSKQSRARNTPKENNFLTFNKYENSHHRVSPQPPSEFRLVKESKVQQKESKRAPKELTKEEIKMMAREEVQSRQAKENVMIPIARGDRFELVPLSALRPEEIIEYVQKQRKTEEEAIVYEERKRRLQEKEKELEQKNRKLQQLAHKRETQKQKDQLVRRPSKEIRVSVHKEIKEEQNDEEEEQQEDDYMSDFESMSASNSIIRSRISSRGNAKNISKEEESIAEDEYSQEFQSYSHSALSKTNPRNPAQSISDYSESYRSISQSYRK